MPHHCALVGLSQVFLFAGLALAQSAPITVTETAGIRRAAFPTAARVHFDRGALAAAQNARLTLGGKETPAQFTAESKWPDGSVEWLAIDWNTTIGPDEKQAFTLEYGAGLASALPRGLSVSEDAESIQAGALRFSKTGNPLLLSVKYRDEEIGQGMNGLFVTDGKGQRHDLAKTVGLRAEILKRGPLVVTIRYTGSVVVDDQYSAPFTLTVETVSSKTIVKIAATVEDPARRLTDIGVGTPLVLGALPWTWDFGTSRWTYGSFRAATDSVSLTQDPAGTWAVKTGVQLYERSPAGNSEPVTWGHFQNTKEVVAFALETSPGVTRRVSFDGSGQALYSLESTGPTHSISVIEHFVTTPVQIGAATSPASLLSPLRVETPTR